MNVLAEQLEEEGRTRDAIAIYELTSSRTYSGTLREMLDF